jgi:hypothetical protein
MEFDYKEDRPNKDKVRQRLTDLILKYKPKKILALESPKFELVKMLPNVKFLIYEKDYTVYKRMKQYKSKFKNILSLNRGNISNFKSSKLKADVIYLDFCGTLSGEKENILKLKDKIRVCKLFVVTFSLREPRQRYEGVSNYYLSVPARLQRMLDMNLNIVFGENYVDTSPMVTVGFEPK